MPEPGAFHGCLGSPIARVRMKADAQYLPHLKGMLEHKEFAFAVGSAANGRARIPCPANLADIRIRVAVARTVHRPRPALDIPVTGRADYGFVPQANHGKGNRGPGILPFERRSLCRGSPAG